MSGRLSNDEFLTSLSGLLSSPHSAGYGSVYFTQKPLTTEPESPDSAPSGQVLIRATNGVNQPKKAKVGKILKRKGPKVKMSTVVEEADLEGFYAKYAEVCKKGMEGLRKRDKKKAKEKAKKKKAGKGS